MLCQCFACQGKYELQRLTVKAHMERDKRTLENPGISAGRRALITGCIARNELQLLQVKEATLSDFLASRLCSDQAQLLSEGRKPRTSPAPASSSVGPSSGTDSVDTMHVDDVLANEIGHSASYKLPQQDLNDPGTDESGVEHPTSHELSLDWEIMNDPATDTDTIEIHLNDIDSDSDILEEIPVQSTQTHDESNSVDTDMHDAISLEPDSLEEFQYDLGDWDDLETSDDLGDQSEDSDDDSCHEPLPDMVVELRRELRNGYTCPEETPAHTLPRSLEKHEEISLAHYINWWKTNSTVKAYDAYARLLTHTTGTPVLSLHNVRKLAETLVNFRVVLVDMCPMSCMAYTGSYSKLTHCTHETKNKPCNQARYRNEGSYRKPSARRQFAVLPVMETIRALFANESTSQSMRYRDACLQEALSLVGTANLVYKDFANSKTHLAHYKHMNLFKDPRDVAFALSSDGAQLTMKRQSNTWVVILILLNLPGHMRYKSENVIINLAIPGPNSPQNLDSFIYPLFQEMAKASEGIWVWDAVDSSFFVLRACLTLVLGDMPGSAKLNGMAGHTAILGDRFSLVKGAKTSEKGSKRIYYPMTPPEKEKYNKDRPTYQLDRLPLRTQKHYWETIKQLGSASDAQRIRITQQTGISRPTLCAASPAFRHPSFFPFDPFHLYYENCMAYMWDLWATVTSADEQTHINKTHLQRLGEYISQAMTTLPPVFCGPVRDVYLKRQSQFKIYEWMALLHWYLVPMFLELSINYSVIDNFAKFVEIVEYSMTITERSEEDLKNLDLRIQSFLTEFERLYVSNDPAKVSRCRLCIFQLIHIPAHIRWNGSVRLGSQATVERSIGELGHRIRSRKAPFANLMRLVKEKELIKILQLYYPQLARLSTHTVTSSHNAESIHLFSRQPPSPKKKLRGDALNKVLQGELDVIRGWLGIPNIPPGSYERWGKIKLKNGYVLRSTLFEAPEGLEKEDPNKRCYRWFKARGEEIFGEAQAFYRILYRGGIIELVVYKPLTNIKRKLNVITSGVWIDELRILKISQIETIVGIWRVPTKTRCYILQKHPGLEMLAQHMPDLAEAEPDTEEVEE